MTILVITTGGTIGALPYFDPIHPPHACTLPEDGRDIVAETIKTVFSSFDTRCFSPGLRDSHAIDDDFRQSLVDTIVDAPEQKILITHGTDSLIQTADYFYFAAQNNPKIREKTIILTGAMIPLTNGTVSDGYLNLLFSLQELTEPDQPFQGIHIVLCDFTTKGYWCPRLYPFVPNRYRKIYAPDGRYNRLYDRG